MEKNNKNKTSKMDLNKMNMVQLRALAKENNLRGYSRLRKNDLINMIFESLEVTNNKEEIKDKIKDENQTNKKLMRNKRKKISQKASKLSKKSKNLRIDINDLNYKRMIWKKR